MITKKKNLEKFKKQLDKSKDPQGRLYLRSKIELATVKISQQNDVLDGLEESKNQFQIMGAENRSRWSLQITRVEEAIDAMIDSFISKMTKRIVNELGFTNFSYNTPDYSDEVKKIIKGV